MRHELRHLLLVFPVALASADIVLYAAQPRPGEAVRVLDYGVTEFALHPTLPVLYANDYRNQSTPTGRSSASIRR
jgi:hypothetical protein